MSVELTKASEEWSELAIFEQVVDSVTEGKTESDFICGSGIVWHIIRLARLVEQQVEYSVHRKLGWSWAGFRVMVNLHAVGAVEPSRLSEILSVSRPTMTSTLNKLERNGYIERQPDPNNRRQVLVSLTAKGKDAVHEAVPEQLRIEKQLVSGLSPVEQQQMLDTLNRLLESLSA
jgi:DNA-binding MarR family transcriptional regulator